MNFLKYTQSLLVALILVGCSDDPGKNFNSAIDAAAKKDWPKAVEKAEKVVKKWPTALTEAFYAICLQQQAKNNEAHVILERLGNDPKNAGDATIQYLCGLSFYNRKEFKEAYPFLINSFQIDKTNDNCLIALFQIATSLNYPDADNLYKYVQQRPNLKNLSVVHNNYGVYLYRQKNNRAMSTLSRGAIGDAVPAELALNRAIILDDRGFQDRAIDLYEQYNRETRNSLQNESLAVARRITELKKQQEKLRK